LLKKSKMIKEIIRGSGFIMLFKVVAAACAFATSVMITRIYGPEIYGEYSLVISIISFLMMFNLFGLDLYMIKKVNEYTDESIIFGFIKKSVNIFSKISILIMILGVCIGLFISHYLFDGRLYLISLFIGLMTIMLSTIKLISNIYRAHGSVFRFSVNENLLFQLPLFLVVLASFFFQKNELHPIWLYFINLFVAAVFAFVICLLFINKKYRSVVLKKYDSTVLVHAYPMMFTSSIIYAMSYADTFMISSFMDNFQVGLYSGIMKLSIPLSFMSGAISSYIAPKIARFYNDGDIKSVKKMYKTVITLLIVFGLLLLTIFFTFSDFFLNLFGPEYLAEINTYYIYILATFISGALFGPIGYFMIMTNNQKIFLYILIIAFFINIGLNYFLIPLIGISGAAVTTLLSTLVWKASGFFFLRLKNIL